MPNTPQFNAAIVLGAFTALGIVFGAAQLMPKPSKGNKLTVASEPSRPAVPPSAVTPAAPEPVIAIPEPVAAGPAPVETAPASPPKAVQITHPIRKLSKRRARRIAKAKAEPCVGPLCVLVR